MARLRAIAASQPRNAAAVRRSRSWRIADMNTSCTRSSATAGGTRASRIPCTMREYRTYNSPKAPRSPSAAAPISSSSSGLSVCASIGQRLMQLFQHSLHIGRCELLHVGLGGQTVDTLRSRGNQRVRVCGLSVDALLGLQLDHPPPFVRPLPRDCEHARLGKRNHFEWNLLALAVDYADCRAGDDRFPRLVASGSLHRQDRVGFTRFGTRVRVAELQVEPAGEELT